MAKFHLIATTSLALCLFATSHAQVTLMVSADTYITNDPNSGPSVAHGTETTMQVRKQLGTNNQSLRILYFQFDLSSVTGDLTGATLILNATSSSRSRTLEINGVVDNALGGQGEFWDENTLSYDDAAGFSPAPSGDYATTSDLTGILATIDMTTNQVGNYFTLPNGAMDTFLASDTNNVVTFTTLYPGPDGNAIYFFETKEAGNGLEAKLYLPNATAVPEPGTVAFLLGGLSLLVVLIRRRRS